MASVIAMLKEEDFRDKVALEKIVVKSTIRSKGGDSTRKFSKWISKIKKVAGKERTPKTWMECWNDNRPVISASKEFYGLPRDIITLIWTYVIESDEGKREYRLRPSLVEDVYHYDFSNDSLTGGLKMVGARVLLQVNGYSRSRVMRKFWGTLPIFSRPYRTPGILRFDPKSDIIHMQDFEVLALQMIRSGGLLDYSKYDYERNTLTAALEGEIRARYHNSLQYSGRLNRMIWKTKYIFSSTRRKQILAARKHHYTKIVYMSKGYSQPPGTGNTWALSKSIQNLAIDYTTLCSCIIAIYMRMEEYHVNATSQTPIAMPGFTSEFGPVSTFFKFLRENGNVKSLLTGDEEWHTLSNDVLFEALLDGEMELILSI